MIKRLLLASLVAVALHARVVALERRIPTPLSTHPGNIFLAGEDIRLALPKGDAERWQLVNYEGQTVRGGSSKNGRVALGRLPVGYYELRTGGTGSSAKITLGVLAPLQAPTPVDSPICIDVAMAWFFAKDQMDSVASLCALAGMNRVRDRLSWEPMEPRRGEFASTNQYDFSAAAQARAGLQVLQVCHISPRWANPDPKRFPVDLRDVYNFYRAMAKRWKTEVPAFEPWNEADIAMFGGHTGSEMATLQKAAYLGLKAGNPGVIACLNVFAIRRAATLTDFDRNHAWPYFDTFNLHHYEPLQNYPALYADFRAVSAGKPLWVTECSVHVKWQGDPQSKELTEADARLQSERLTKTYVLAIHQGAQAVFYFMLPHYTEGPLQYGILRHDLTPCPAFVAAAAAGRLLAGAKPRGRIEIGDRLGQAYCFDAVPDGKPSQVLVAWTREPQRFELRAEPRACFDHLGRPQPVDGKGVTVDRSPVYIIMDRSDSLPLIAPPPPAKLLPGEPIPVVLQALFPEKDILLEKSAYRLAAGQRTTVPLFLYNFSQEKVRGTLSLTAPAGYQASVATQVEAGPGERKEYPMTLEYDGPQTGNPSEIRVTGDFGAVGSPTLAFRLLVE